MMSAATKHFATLFACLTITAGCQAQSNTAIMSERLADTEDALHAVEQRMIVLSSDLESRALTEIQASIVAMGNQIVALTQALATMEANNARVNAENIHSLEIKLDKSIDAAEQAGKLSNSTAGKIAAGGTGTVSIMGIMAWLMMRGKGGKDPDKPTTT